MIIQMMLFQAMPAQGVASIRSSRSKIPTPTCDEEAVRSGKISCPRNDLAALFDRYCSDKGTKWQSRHHYSSAYDSLFRNQRDEVRSFLEIGIGEDTAPSLAAWRLYFPNANLHAVDIKTKEEFDERARPGGATERLILRQKPWCAYEHIWDDPRVHLHLDTDASDPEQLRKLRSTSKDTEAAIPSSFDVIIDDGSHRFPDQEKTLLELWPSLSPGGVYIIEDIFVGALPWDANHAGQVPTKNDDCGGECFFPQKLNEHPFLLDRFHQLKQPASNRLREETVEILTKNSWFFVVTGVHKGGGLDVAFVVTKDEESDSSHKTRNGRWKKMHFSDLSNVFLAFLAISLLLNALLLFNTNLTNITSFTRDDRKQSKYQRVPLRKERDED